MCQTFRVVSLTCCMCTGTENERRGGGSRKKAWLRAGFITEHDIPSQLSLGTKQKAHQEQDVEEEVEGGGWSSSLLLYKIS